MFIPFLPAMIPDLHQMLSLQHYREWRQQDCRTIWWFF